jgi:HK97 gp10 family phage protein
MSDIRVTLDQAAMKALLSGPQGPVYSMLQTKARQVKNAAVNTYVPVRTRLLQKSIEFTLTEERGTPIAIVSANTTYAKYVHQGTRKMAGRPFLIQALRQVFPGSS